MTLRTRLETALENSARLRRIRASHPRLASVMAGLMTAGGRELALSVVAAAVFWFAFFGVVQDLLADDPLVRADLRIVAFLQTLRTHSFSEAMVLFAGLADWQVIAAGAVLLGVLMYLHRQMWWLAALALCLAGEQALSLLLRALFGRPRPDLHNALIPAAGGSFPSGHALAASIFYGFAACYLAAQARRWSARVGIFFAAALLVAVSGFSRVYLGVHWPSDVVGSFALGPAWIATVLVILGAGWIPLPQLQPVAVAARPLWVAFGLWLAAAGGYYLLTDPLVTPEAARAQAVALGSGDFDAQLFQHLPRFSEDITGAQIEPINAVLIASEADLVQAMAGAGWTKALPLGVRSGLQLVWDEWRNLAEPDAPGVPSFLKGVPNEMAFESPTDQHSVRERHHLHIWSTSLTKDGVPVWVGTVHLDTSGTLYGKLTYHKIDPNLDLQREHLRETLMTSPCLIGQHTISVTAPMKGRNSLHNAFFTDGKAVEADLRCR